MIDFSLFDKALKITWVKRLCADDSGPWKLIPLSLLSNVGGKLLFQYYYDLKYYVSTNTYQNSIQLY